MKVTKKKRKHRPKDFNSLIEDEYMKVMGRIMEITCVSQQNALAMGMGSQVNFVPSQESHALHERAELLRKLLPNR